MRPRVLPAVALALAVLATACGDGGGGDAQLGGGGAGTVAPSSTEAPEEGATSTTAAASGAPTTRPAATTPPAPPRTSPPAPPPAPPPTPPPPESGLTDVDIRLTRVAGFSDPVAMAVRANDGAIYVAERRGRVRALRGGSVDATPVLDIGGDVGGSGSDAGLLGMAFSPDGSRLYVNYTDPDNDTHIVEFTMAGGNADPATRREVLFVDQPYANNKGGHLAFGPDDRLYIGLGDGGGGGDPQGNGQSLNTLLGKMLRIDPRPDIGSAYTVPADNPFVNQGDARPEIWAYGLRNPWRYSFDRLTGDLWIGDVGQNAREEVNYAPVGARGGQNYGWARLEGTRTYSGAAPSNAVAPIFDYAKAGGNCAVTGGYVYRGSRIPDLVGAYVYADRCVGQIQALRQSGGRVVDQRAFGATARPLTSFGQDGAGELYALSADGGLHRIDPA
ncbi:MAG: PQQ-dependent sugar dehydrogenase [Acidimicrobiia bacterium]